MMKDLLIKTADGSYTVFHPNYRETYHSVKAGAIKETLHKFFYPSFLPYKAKRQNKLFLLEIGFGLGYNLAITIAELLKINPSIKLTYIGLEKEIKKSLLEHLSLPPPYREIYQLLKEKILKENKTSFLIEGNLEINILLGKAEETIKEVSSNWADAIYHDPFSPKKNPELWELSFLAEEKRVIKKEGWWVSYSCARKVRENLKKLGFYIFDVKPLNRRGPSTAATLSEKNIQLIQTLLK